MYRSKAGTFGARRQQQRVQVLLLVSFLGCILFGTVSAMFLFSQSDGEKVVEVYKEARLDALHVLVPVKQIEAGTALEPSAFKFEERPKAGLSARTITTLDKIQGQYARSLIIAGQPLVEDLISPVKPNTILSGQIPSGFRAVTIRVDARTSVEGWAQPGAYVDVVWSTVVRGLPAVNTIVQNARILSAGGQANKDGQQSGEGAVPGTCTLLVAADDANKIQLASTSGTLSLSLKGDRPDVSPIKNRKPITVKDLLPEAQDTNVADEYTGPVIKVKGADGKDIEYIMKNNRLVPKAKVEEKQPKAEG